jgi:hypothetical protein
MQEEDACDLKTGAVMVAEAPAVAASAVPSVSEVAARSSPGRQKSVSSVERGVLDLLGSSPKSSHSPAGHGSVGFMISQHHPFRIVSVIHGGPTQKCGLVFEGDVLQAIDGVKVVGKTIEAVRRAIAGPLDTAVVLALLGPGNDVKNVRLFRAAQI